jgi:hypothetical protein
MPPPKSELVREDVWCRRRSFARFEDEDAVREDDTDGPDAPAVSADDDGPKRGEERPRKLTIEVLMRRACDTSAVAAVGVFVPDDDESLLGPDR